MITTATDANGRICYPFEVQWPTDEGVQSTVIWATSGYHAELLLEDLKNHAQIIGMKYEYKE